MNGFMHLLTQAAQLRALRHWRQHLTADGLLLLEVQYPDITELAGLNGHLEIANTWVESETGATCLKLLARTVDPLEQIIHVTVIYEALRGENPSQRAATTFDLRYLWGSEAKLLLEKAGFVREAVYGGWDMQPLTSDSERMILVARPKR